MFSVSRFMVLRWVNGSSSSRSAGSVVIVWVRVIRWRDMVSSWVGNVLARAADSFISFSILSERLWHVSRF